VPCATFVIMSLKDLLTYLLTSLDVRRVVWLFGFYDLYKQNICY